MLTYIFSYEYLTILGLTIIRSGIGILFIGHGYLKILKGSDELKWMGKQMSVLGITFLPTLWGISALLAELVGGICLTLGLYTRIASLFLAFTMGIATAYHIKNGDSYGYISFPLSQLIIFVGLILTGGGPLSLDYLI
jgi:putative oxidoreductase